MENDKLTRREFLYFTSLGLAGLATPLVSEKVLAGSMDRLINPPEGYSIIDPPAGVALKEPPEIAYANKKNGLVEVTLDTKLSGVEIAGKKVELITYNSLYPSPAIRVKRGDRLKILHRNSLPRTDRKNALGHKFNVINLHTHGLHVSPSGNSDNVFVHIQPGEEFLYEYDTSKQESGSMSYYHPHQHGLTAWHMWNGLAGPLIVEDETETLSDFETHVLVLQDLSIEEGRAAAHTPRDFITGKEGDIVMVNGQVNPVLDIRPGQVQRWRVVNACTARYFKLSLEGHDLYLAGTDGGLLDKPYPIESLLLTPGERAELLVVANRGPGTYRLLSLPYDRRMNRIEKLTLMTVACEGKRAGSKLPERINPEAERLDIDISSLPVKKIYLIMANNRGFINLKDFDVDPYVLTSRVGTYEVWELINISPMDHPFHQHINAARILSVTGGNPSDYEVYTKTPAWKDTINVPFMGKVRMLVPVMDFTGRTLFHCHILEHEDLGMMGVWNIVE